MASTGEAGRFRFVVGMVLLLVAGFGPVLWDATHHRQASQIPVAELDRRRGERVLPYVTRVNRAVYGATYHCEPTTPQTWAAAALAPVSPQVGHAEGILAADWLRCGFCSQVSFVVADVLTRNGVEAYGRGLDGHVVVGFSHGGRDYVADPDLRVDPFVVEWDNPGQLAGAVAREYAAWGPMPHGMVRTLNDVYTDTATDGVQDAAWMRDLADDQAKQLAAVEWLRWVLVAAGVVLASSPYAPRKVSATKVSPADPAAEVSPISSPAPAL